MLQMNHQFLRLADCSIAFSRLTCCRLTSCGVTIVGCDLTVGCDLAIGCDILTYSGLGVVGIRKVGEAVGGDFRPGGADPV